MENEQWHHTALQLCSDLRCGAEWLYDWQTLVSGLLALEAAAIAWRQLGEQRRQARTDRSGKLRAARAALPLALNQVMSIAEMNARGLFAEWPVESRASLATAIRAPLPTSRFNVAGLPTDVIAVLERVIELCDNEPVAARLESILREIQIFESRSRPSGLNQLKMEYGVVDYLEQVASIYARAESLFDYARGRYPGPSGYPLWDRVKVVARNMGMEVPALVKSMEAHEAGGWAPGEADKPFLA